MMFLMVPAQPIFTEVIAGHAQNAVNVVWIVGEFRIWRDDGIVFDQQRRTVNAIVHCFACLSRAHPREVGACRTRRLNPGAVRARNIRLKVPEVLVNQGLEQIMLAPLQSSHSGGRL